MEPTQAQKKKEEPKLIGKRTEPLFLQKPKTPAQAFFGEAIQKKVNEERKLKAPAPGFFGQDVEKGLLERKKKQDEKDFVEGTRKRHEQQVKTELDAILSAKKIITLHETIFGALKKKKKKDDEDLGGGGPGDDDDKEGEENSEDIDRNDSENSEESPKDNVKK